MTSIAKRQVAGIGPERPAGQGLDHNQEESGNNAIYHLLASSEGGATTDLVATVRTGGPQGAVYEAWAARGMVRWVRTYAPGGGYEYRIIEEAGVNPLARQDPRALATLEDELGAGADPTNPQRAFVEPESLTHPYAYERLSQLFDSPNAPDLVVSPRSYAYGRQPGQHGALDVIQSRSPLLFSGPGVKQGVVVEALPRQIDIAPTIARLLGWPLIDGRDSTGRTSTERGVEPDVYLRRQDGEVIDEVLVPSGSTPERVYILLLDGQSHTELTHRLATEPDAIPNLRRLIEHGSLLKWGSITNFPSITWPSHNAIGTGAWCGHHDIVNPTYYLRAERQTVSPQGQQFDTAKFLGADVETLYEAFHRIYGSWTGMHGAFTASLNEPCTRGADHASLERVLIGDRERLKALTREREVDISPKWAENLRDGDADEADFAAAEGHDLRGNGLIDTRALAQAHQLFEDGSHATPTLTYFEFALPDAAAHDFGPHHRGAKLALDESDVRIGRILAQLDDLGLFESTLFVVTTDHGMAIQDISLNGNPARIPERAGMAAVTTEPLIYLRDMAIEIVVAHDGRTCQVTILDNDADTTGEHPPVAGAEVLVADHRDGKVAITRADAAGVCGFAIPADMRPEDLRMSVRADAFNTRHMLLDGSNLALDLVEALYGGR